MGMGPAWASSTLLVRAGRERLLAQFGVRPRLPATAVDLAPGGGAGPPRPGRGADPGVGGRDRSGGVGTRAHSRAPGRRPARLLPPPAGLAGTPGPGPAGVRA